MTLSRTLPVAAFAIMSAALTAAQDEGPAAVDGVVAGESLAEETRRDLGEIFVEANAAYEQGDYPKAIRNYQKLIEQQAGHGRLHFNLGNAYLRHGELGRAIAELRRGRDLLPRDEDIRANLLFARQSTHDAIAPPEPPAILSTLMFWHYRLSRAELAMLAVVLSFVFWSLAILRLFHRDSEVLGWLLIGLLVVLLGTLGSLVGHRFFSPAVAVVVPQEIEAFTAPDAESVVRFKLHAGTELRIKDEREGWLRITLPDDQQGWIEAVWTEVLDD